MGEPLTLVISMLGGSLGKATPYLELFNLSGLLPSLGPQVPPP